MEMIWTWLTENYLELFGALTGIAYVILEIRQNPLLWPIGIITSGVYIWVFFTGRFYADMCLQVYYVVISILGWFWWIKGTKHAPGADSGTVKNETLSEGLRVTRIKSWQAIVLSILFALLWILMYYILSHFTNSPVPAADSFITSLSIIATWMLARKIYEHWYLWIIVNFVSCVVFLARGLYPTLVLYLVYGIMSFAGLREWKKSFQDKQSHEAEKGTS
ncbi:MAG: nicotinamide riboside transporter PnuC [Bacteroidales bacterium]